ncbi:nesprin-2, partial [Lates japonicus]
MPALTKAQPPAIPYSVSSLLLSPLYHNKTPIFPALPFNRLPPQPHAGRVRQGMMRALGSGREVLTGCPPVPSFSPLSSTSSFSKQLDAQTMRREDGGPPVAPRGRGPVSTKARVSRRQLLGWVTEHPVSLRKQEIADRLNAWIIFNEKNKELCEWLTQMENKVAHNSDLNIEEMVEKLKKDCMEEINLFSENKTHLKQLGEQLITASNKTKETEINDKLKDINDRWQHLFDHIEA